MPKRSAKLLWILFIMATGLRAQNPAIGRLIESELKMTFPSIYFRHNSTDYAAMPYTADSCFKYISLRLNDLRSLVIWRDSSETEQLTYKRIKKLKAGLRKYVPTGRVIQPMDGAQKISQRTISQATNKDQIGYLRSLNSVFDVSGAVIPGQTSAKGRKTPHTERPRFWCVKCWKRGRFSKEYRLHLKQQKKKAVAQAVPVSDPNSPLFRYYL